MRCPACGHENKDNSKFCIECGAPLQKKEKKYFFPFLFKSKKDEKKQFSIGNDMSECVVLSFDCKSDDGLIPMPPLEDVVSCPLNYTHTDVLNELVKNKVINSARYYHIQEFFNCIAEYNRNLPDGGKQKNYEDATLADALKYAGQPRLTLFFAHRQEMIDRAGPNVCLYGCPVSSDLEKQYADVVSRTEIISLED